MTRAEMEARCRQIIAEMLVSGRSGELDQQVYAALRAGLALRAPRPSKAQGGGAKE